METGSFMNAMMSGPAQAEPKVGDGATITRWSDRSAGTVIKVTAHTVVVREDKATRTDKNGMSEVQEYRYEPDPNGSIYTFRKTKRGWRCPEGHGLAVGYRKAYHDFSF